MKQYVIKHDGWLTDRMLSFITDATYVSGARHAGEGGSTVVQLTDKQYREASSLFYIEPVREEVVA